MTRFRSVAFSLTVVALAVVGAGCQSGSGSAPASAAGAQVAADNTAEVCDAFRRFELDHLDEPAAAGLAGFNAIAAADMAKLAERATDPVVERQLRAIATQIGALADDRGDRTYDEVEQANVKVFAAGGEAWVALEDRCGPAIIPSP